MLQLATLRYLLSINNLITYCWEFVASTHPYWCLFSYIFGLAPGSYIGNPSLGSKFWGETGPEGKSIRIKITQGPYYPFSINFHSRPRRNSKPAPFHRCAMRVEPSPPPPDRFVPTSFLKYVLGSLKYWTFAGACGMQTDGVPSPCKD